MEKDLSVPQIVAKSLTGHIPPEHARELTVPVLLIAIVKSAFIVIPAKEPTPTYSPAVGIHLLLGLFCLSLKIPPALKIISERVAIIASKSEKKNGRSIIYPNSTKSIIEPPNVA